MEDYANYFSMYIFLVKRENRKSKMFISRIVRVFPHTFFPKKKVRANSIRKIPFLQKKRVLADRVVKKIHPEQQLALRVPVNTWQSGWSRRMCIEKSLCR